MVEKQSSESESQWLLRSATEIEVFYWKKKKRERVFPPTNTQVTSNDDIPVEINNPNWKLRWTGK